MFTCVKILNTNTVHRLADTTKNARIAISLLADLAVIKPIPGCVRIACSRLMTASLLQDVRGLDVSWLSTTFYPQTWSRFINSWHQNASNLQAWCNLMKPTGLMQLDEANRLDATWWSQQTWCNLMKPTGLICNLLTKLHQPGKTHNFKQICGISWQPSLGTQNLTKRYQLKF